MSPVMAAMSAIAEYIPYARRDCRFGPDGFLPHDRRYVVERNPLRDVGLIAGLLWAIALRRGVGQPGD
jgi:hypothetical protein